jgi:Zn finger protein HypA/HybF involved in hydrogenase expression
MEQINNLIDLPKEKQSEYILNSNIGSEIENMWGFNPYFIKTSITALNRGNSPFTVECKNCNNQIFGTFVGLERMHMRGYYCPACHGSYNPVYKSLLPKDFVETNEEYKQLLCNEYSAMTAIKDKYGHQPYRFSSIDAGKKITLEHVACSSIFSATLSMIFDNSNYTDKYTGGNIELPYCPKCNSIFIHENINYGGLRFVENLHNVYASSNKEFPYEFNEEDIYRFKGYRHDIPCICKNCKKTFVTMPERLFEIGSSSKCPFCGNKPFSTDSGKRRNEEVQLDTGEDTVPQENNTADATLNTPETSPVKYEDLIDQGYVQDDNALPEDHEEQSNEEEGGEEDSDDVSMVSISDESNDDSDEFPIIESSKFDRLADTYPQDKLGDATRDDILEELSLSKIVLEEQPLGKKQKQNPSQLVQDSIQEQLETNKFQTLMEKALEEGSLTTGEKNVDEVIATTAKELGIPLSSKQQMNTNKPKHKPKHNVVPSSTITMSGKRESIEQPDQPKEEAVIPPSQKPVMESTSESADMMPFDEISIPVMEIRPNSTVKRPVVIPQNGPKQLSSNYAERQPKSSQNENQKKVYIDGDLIRVTFVIKRQGKSS